MKYQEINPETLEPVGSPTDLPECLVGIPDFALADLAQYFDDELLEEMGQLGKGWVPAGSEFCPTCGKPLP